MRTVIQRVNRAEVVVNDECIASIKQGFLILVGVEHDDQDEDIDYLARKISGLRVFSDSAGLMNLAISDIGGEMILVSQFTLHASTKKGNRPSFIRAARPDQAEPMYLKLAALLSELSNSHVQTGSFGADMKISLLNDGPVTIIIDSKTKD